jgi:3-hydroxyisobutyrate dehydrogenase-like beta-hydroxyacid dehydrogenase
MSQGFIGLGSMGGNMAKHIANSKYDLTVYDKDPAAMEDLVAEGADTESSPRKTAEQSDVVFLSLPNPKAVETVVYGDDGVIAGLDSGDVLVDITTSLPELTKQIADDLSEKEAAMLDAGVTRGIDGAQEGNVALMIGGSSSVLEEVRPIMETFAGDITHIGEESGTGHAVKLLTNYIWSTSLISACEAVSLGEKYGLDPEKMVQIFNDGAGRNVVIEGTFPEHILTEKYDTEFPMGLWDKDLRLFAEFSEKNDSQLMMGAVARQMAGQAEAVLGGDADATRMYEFIENMLGKDDTQSVSNTEIPASED